MMDKSTNSPESVIYADCYFSRDNGLGESQLVFVAGNGLPGAMAGRTEFHIGETGFGTGLNLLATLRALTGVPPLTLHWWSVEKYPLKVSEIAEFLSPFGDIADLLPGYLELWNSLLDQGSACAWHHGSLDFGPVQLQLHVWFGDVLEMLADLPRALPEWSAKLPAIDAWMLDGHSPVVNPDMWSPQVFAGIAASSHQATSLATYSAAGIVKQGLRQAGFLVTRHQGYGRKHHRLSARFIGLQPDPGAC